MGSTTELRRAVKTRFFPYAVERGFTIDKQYQPRSTIFRRQTGTHVEIFEVQWDKYGTPRFVLRFGTCPVEGLLLDGVVRPPCEVLPTWCPETGSLQPRRGAGTRSWFRQDSTVLQRLLGQPALRAPTDVVDQLLDIFPELERYWATGEVGPHLRRWPTRVFSSS